MIAYHCDREDCDTWSSMLDLFIIVSYPDTKKLSHYCCNWCMVVEESKNVEPTETL